MQGLGLAPQLKPFASLGKPRWKLPSKVYDAHIVQDPSSSSFDTEQTAHWWLCSALRGAPSSCRRPGEVITGTSSTVEHRAFLSRHAQVAASRQLVIQRTLEAKSEFWRRGSLAAPRRREGGSEAWTESICTPIIRPMSKRNGSRPPSLPFPPSLGLAWSSEGHEIPHEFRARISTATRYLGERADRQCVHSPSIFTSASVSGLPRMNA